MVSETPEIKEAPRGVAAYTGSALASELGFTDDLFYGWIEICETPERGHILYVHYIMSNRRREGNVKKLFTRWRKDYDLRIVKPVTEMKALLTGLGDFEATEEYMPGRYPYNSVIEVWKSTSTPS